MIRNASAARSKNITFAYEGESMLKKVLQDAFEEVRREDMLRGAAAGGAKALVLVLERRFGPLPAHVHRQIDPAGRETLATWMLKVADGATLVDIFGAAPEVIRGEEELTSFRQEALAEGARLGTADMLWILLERRFTTLPEDLRQRVGDAKRSTLEAWLARAVDAATLEAVFDSRVLDGG